MSAHLLEQRNALREYVAYLGEAGLMLATFLLVHGWQWPSDYLARGKRIAARLERCQALNPHAKSDADALPAPDRTRVEEIRQHWQHPVDYIAADVDITYLLTLLDRAYPPPRGDTAPTSEG